MWYTHYHSIKSEQYEAINELYRWVLSRLTIKDGRNLLEIFNADKELEWEADGYFHECSQDEDWNIEISVSDWFDFTKTARKMYDVAIVLAYAFDDWLCWNHNSSWDYNNVSGSYIREIADWFWISQIHIKTNLRWYIQEELDENMYTIEMIDNVCKFVYEFAQDYSQKEQDEEVEDEVNMEEKDEEDMQEISDRIANWFTSGITWNGRGRTLELN